MTSAEQAKIDWLVRHSGPDADVLVGELLRVQIAYEDILTFFHQRLLRGFLWANGNNQSATAEKMGIHRNTLHRLMLDVGIDPAAIDGNKYRPRKARPLNTLAELRKENEAPIVELRREYTAMIKEGAGCEDHP